MDDDGRRAEEEEETQSPERKRPKQAPPPSLKHTFAPARWLSDESISFAYQRLEGNSDACGADCQKLPEAVLLIDPPTAFWLGMQTEVQHRNEARQALKVLDRQLVLCPVNDNRDGGLADAGSHWGLLVWDRQGLTGRDASAGRFIYYDSGFCHMEANHQQAQTLANNLAGQSVPMTVGQCPKQTNSFDCGMYVILLSELIVKAFLARHGSRMRAEDHVSMAPAWETQVLAVTPKDVAERRAFFYRTLSTMMVAAAAGA